MATVSPAMSGKVLRAGSRGLGNLVGGLKVNLGRGEVCCSKTLPLAVKLPGWDVADDFDVVNGVEREGKGHARCNDHLGDGRRQEVVV